MNINFREMRGLSRVIAVQSDDVIFYHKKCQICVEKGGRKSKKAWYWKVHTHAETNFINKRENGAFLHFVVDFLSIFNPRKQVKGKMLFFLNQQSTPKKSPQLIPCALLNTANTIWVTTKCLQYNWNATCDTSFIIFRLTIALIFPQLHISAHKTS